MPQASASWNGTDYFQQRDYLDETTGSWISEDPQPLQYIKHEATVALRLMY